ncbi:MAG: bifunctional phosphoglucose/phosphomannose isomerase [Candidatus Bathyarchaeota archaeon]|nr:bifunctional phosphoglucose/phosphomannose isomerase [Candidatus Bathyarchaeota archaeon]MDH5495067.1 bifunctional phosphoglucose/phosphomannose isomerase [Candidatus Bathyarchaeota archaeon]
MQKLTVLDQPDKVKAIDKSNMLGACEKTPDFCRDAVKRAEKVEIPISYKSPKNVIVAGMGGSAIGGELLKNWLYDRASIPIEVCRDYVLPAYANENSLIVAVSYSGETEETLSAFLEAIKRRCMVLTVSSGGHLQTFSQKLKIPHILIPSDSPAPRAAIAYLFFPLVVLMKKLCVAKKANEEIEETLRVLQKISEENALRTPLKNNMAKKLALEIGDTVPIVYGFRQYNAVARRLKCQFNENSKVPSKFDVFSELNHNEVVGWEAPRNLTKAFSILVIRDSKEPREIKQRIEVTKQIASKKVCRILEIRAVGKQKLAKMLSAMYMGDFVSIYLALLRGVDPTPTKTIAHLKREMKKEFDMTARLEKEIEKIT